jgi:putative endonuclease
MAFCILVHMKFYFVYVLFSLKDQKLYIGYSSDVFQRVEQHNAGENVSTKFRRPLKLIYYESHLFKEDAIRREKYFKTTKGKRALKLMLSNSMKRLKEG